MSKLLWDGSFLGTYTRKCLGAKIAVKDGFKLYTLRTKSFTARCLLKALKNTSIPCILDELKVCFGMNKIGTHRIQIGKRMYVMYRCTLNDVILTKFPKNDMTEDLKLEMQKLIIFRYVLSIPFTRNSSFMVRNGSKSRNVYSFYEPQTFIGERTIDPSERFLCTWFGEEDITNKCMEFIHKLPTEEWSEFLFRFNTDIDKIIQRLDKDYVWLSGFIIEKIIKLRGSLDKLAGF